MGQLFSFDFKDVEVDLILEGVGFLIKKESESFYQNGDRLYRLQTLREKIEEGS